eukprot:jgi/Bigna1/72335/fgenesh1_pg.19_\
MFWGIGQGGRNVLAAVLFSLLPKPSLQDLPVHCPHSTIKGTWEISYENAGKEKDLMCTDGEGVKVCQYGSCFVSKVLGQPSFQHSRKAIFELHEPDLVKAWFDDSETHIQGSWTTVYDEGFEVHVAGRVYFAFSSFDPDSHESLCSSTWPGWHSQKDNPDGRTWGCFTGRRVASRDPRSDNHHHHHHRFRNISGSSGGSRSSKKAAQDHRFQRLDASNGGLHRRHHHQGVKKFHQSPRQAAAPFSSFLETGSGEGLYAAENLYIRRLNRKANGSWTAVRYPELEKHPIARVRTLIGSVPRRHDHHHHHRGRQQQYEGKEGDNSQKQQLLLDGDSTQSKQIESSRFHHNQDASSETMTKTTRKSVSALLEEYGSSFDWRAVDGQDFVDEVISQECGDCYAAATVSMINSRIRINSANKIKAQYDWRQVVRCDPYNQGCAGGYPYLVEKFVHDYGLTRSGKCPLGTPMPLLQESDSHDLARFKSEGEDYEGPQQLTEAPEVRVRDYSYLGGFYGATTTEEMMREVKTVGPVAVGIGGSLELMHYKSGIYRPTDEEPPPQYDFESVDHAVVIVGWGVDESSKEPYWILKNSYGNWWGEKGYFRIPLEGDVRHIRSLVTRAEPVLGNHEYFKQGEQERKLFHNKVLNSSSLVEKGSEETGMSRYGYNEMDEGPQLERFRMRAENALFEAAPLDPATWKI